MSKKATQLCTGTNLTNMIKITLMIITWSQQVRTDTQIMRPVLQQRWNRVSGSRVSNFGRIGSGQCDPVLSFNMRVYRGGVSTE